MSLRCDMISPGSVCSSIVPVSVLTGRPYYLSIHMLTHPYPWELDLFMLSMCICSLSCNSVISTLQAEHTKDPFLLYGQPYSRLRQCVTAAAIGKYFKQLSEAMEVVCTCVCMLQQISVPFKIVYPVEFHENVFYK